MSSPVFHPQIHRPSYRQIKPGSRIGKPGGKKGQHHIHGNLGVKHIPYWIFNCLAFLFKRKQAAPRMAENKATPTTPKS